jgi:acyl carrier protein
MDSMSADLEKIRGIVADALRDAGDESPFTDDDSLVVTDRLSSLDVVNILLELEQAFGIEIHEDELDVMRFDTVASIRELLEEAAAR